MKKNITKGFTQCIIAEMQVLLDRHTADLKYDMNDINYKYINKLIEKLMPNNLIWLTDLKYEIETVCRRSATIIIFVTDKSKVIQPFEITIFGNIKRDLKRDFRRNESVVIIKDVDYIKAYCNDYEVELHPIECLL